MYPRSSVFPKWSPLVMLVCSEGLGSHLLSPVGREWEEVRLWQHEILQGHRSAVLCLPGTGCGSVPWLSSTMS